MKLFEDQRGIDTKTETDPIKKVVNVYGLQSYINFGVLTLEDKGADIDVEKAILAFQDLRKGVDNPFPKKDIVTVLEAIYEDEEADSEDGILGDDPDMMAEWLGMPDADFGELKDYVLKAIREAADFVKSKMSTGTSITTPKMTWDELYMALVKKTKDTEKADDIFARLTQDYPDYKWKEPAPANVVKKLLKL